MSSVVKPVDSGLQSLELFFDADALSSLFNRRVRASHLRWKPGTSAVARLHDDDGVGWLALYGGDASVKLDKTIRRAVAGNLTLEQFTRTDGVLASGPIDLDPRLYGALRPFRRENLAVQSRGVPLLKYNPLRRIVFTLDTDALGRVVGRVSGARRSVTRETLSVLAGGGVPLLVPLAPDVVSSSLPTGRHIEYLPWYGKGDLSAVPPPVAMAPARAAGTALALLHQQPPACGLGAPRDPMPRLRSLIDENAELLPENRWRLERIRTNLETLLSRSGKVGVIHGDFSADQVLVEGSDVRLIDFDRASCGSPASDLGSFAASEALAVKDCGPGSVLSLPRTAALLDGYGAAADQVDEREVLTWTAFHLLNRLREPFRACSPDWRHQVDARLGMIEEFL